MPRSRCLLALLLLGLAGPLFAADSPLAGTWKVTFYERNVRATLWLLEIDASGKSVKLLQGLQRYEKATVSEFKPLPTGGLSFTLTAGNNRSLFSIQPPCGKDKEVLFGTIRIGSNVGPIRLERTTDTVLNQDRAVAPIAGVVALQTAVKESDPAERIRQLQQLIKESSGKPLAQLACQVLLNELVRAKAKPQELRAAIDTYLAEVAPHGPEMQLGLRFGLVQNLLNQPAYVSLAVPLAREAINLVRPDHPADLRMSVQLLLANSLHATRATDEIPAITANIHKIAEQFLATIKAPLMRLQGQLQIASALIASTSPTVAELGLDYARQAYKSLSEETPLQARLLTHKVLLQGLKKCGKEEEARTVASTVDRLEKDMDAEYRKSRPGFEIDEYSGRKPPTRRTVLVELFSGVNNPLCLASDAAFEAAFATYPAHEAVFLHYAVHGPLPSALVNPASEARFAFYKAALESIPGVFVDGKWTANLGGNATRARISYENLREAIDKAGESDTPVQIKLNVTRKGESITVKAEVSGLEKPAASRKLFLALVERQVRYQGGNGQRLHLNVVRGLLGEAVAVSESTLNHTATVDLGSLGKTLANYLADFSKKNNVRWGDLPVGLGPLTIVAWVQDENSKQVFQAASIAVPDK